MFIVSALLLDDALKPATPLTNGTIDETLRQTLDISQGSVAAHLRCGGIFTDSIITNFKLWSTTKRDIIPPIRKVYAYVSSRRRSVNSLFRLCSGLLSTNSNNVLCYISTYIAIAYSFHWLSDLIRKFRTVPLYLYRQSSCMTDVFTTLRALLSRFGIISVNV